jgi:type II secretory pathway pseudopilin PulG
MKKALTIGELLITMAIIGIIATLVLPGLLKDYHKKLYVAKLKKSIEIVETAINQACVDNNVSYFGQTSYASSAGSGSNQQAFVNKYFKKVGNITAKPFAAKYGTLATGEEATVGLASEHGWAKLASGEALSFFCGGAKYCVIRVDVNSTDGPNIGGRDMFMFMIEKATNKIYEESPSSECGTRNTGDGCYSKLVEDNWEMNY